MHLWQSSCMCLMQKKSQKGCNKAASSHALPLQYLKLTRPHPSKGSVPDASGRQACMQQGTVMHGFANAMGS